MKKKFKHKKLVIVLVIIVAAIIVLVGVAKRKLNSVAEATNIVQLEKVDKRDLSDFISLTGTVSGETKINYSSTAATEIKTVNVQVGDVVKEGDVIEILFGARTVKVKVLKVQETVKKDEASELFEYL